MLESWGAGQTGTPPSSLPAPHAGNNNGAATSATSSSVVPVGTTAPIASPEGVSDVSNHRSCPTIPSQQFSPSRKFNVSKIWSRSHYIWNIYENRAPEDSFKFILRAFFFVSSVQTKRWILPNTELFVLLQCNSFFFLATKADTLNFSRSS